MNPFSIINKYCFKKSKIPDPKLTYSNCLFPTSQKLKHPKTHKLQSNDKDKQQALTFKKLEQTNVQHFGQQEN